MLKTAIMDEKSLTHMKDRAEALLESRGVTIGHAALCARLREAGCTVEGARVRFPQEVLRGAVAKAPRQFTLYAPEEGFDLPFPRPDGGFYTRGNTGACNWRAADGSTRALRLADADEWFTLVNAMEHVDFVALPSVTGGGAPVKGGDLMTLAHALQLSKKHIWVQPYGVENVRGLLSIAAAAVGGSDALRARSPVSFISCSVPLLGIQQMDAEILLRCAAAGVPVQPCSLPTGGANAPVTPQGTALVCCAEVLAQIVILQLLCPGLPVVATPLPFSMDMLTTYTLQSAPETALCRMLCMQFFEEGYGLPAHSYGTGTDSLTEDGQSLAERVSLMHMMALSGASVLGGAGQLETAKTIGPLTLIADDELFGVAQRLRRGLTVDDETLDWEELAGDEEELADGFLMTGHTLRHCGEATRPQLFSRVGVPNWKAAGCPTFEDRVRTRYEALSAAPTRPQWPQARTRAIDQALRDALAAVGEG